MPWTIQSMEFSRPEYQSGQLFPSPGDLPNPGIKSRSPALQIFFLPAEPQGKPKNTGVASLSLFQRIFLTQELTWDLWHCGWILYQLSYQGSPIGKIRYTLLWKHVHICMAESLCCSPETIITLLIGYTLMQNKQLKVKNKNKKRYNNYFKTNPKYKQRVPCKEGNRVGELHSLAPAGIFESSWKFVLESSMQTKGSGRGFSWTILFIRGADIWQGKSL